MDAVDDDAPLCDWQPLEYLAHKWPVDYFPKRLYDGSLIHFLVGQGPLRQRMPAHRFVLAVDSIVFARWLLLSLPFNVREVEVADVEPSGFLVLLKYIYSFHIYINAENVLATMYAAQKYEVPGLKNECSTFLQKNITYSNAFSLLIQARLYNYTGLETKCLTIIDSYPNAFEAADFINIDHEILCDVICRDTLEMKEVEVFHAAMKWSEAECKRRNMPVTMDDQRAVLGRALKLIRLPTMTIDEFTDNVVKSGILTDNEVTLLKLYITTNEQKPSVEFPCIPRAPNHDYEFFVDRFLNLEPLRYWRDGDINDPQVIKFMVDCPIFILGFSLYSFYYIRQHFIQTCIELFDEHSNVVGSIRTLYEREDSSTFEVRFSDKILLRENSEYRVSLHFEESKGLHDGMDRRYYGTGGQSEVSVESPRGKKIKFKFWSDVNNFEDNSENPNKYFTTVERGQIPQIIFKLP